MTLSERLGNHVTSVLKIWNSFYKVFLIFLPPLKVSEGDTEVVFHCPAAVPGRCRAPAPPCSTHRYPYLSIYQGIIMLFPSLTQVSQVPFEINFIKLCFISSSYNEFCYALNAIFSCRLQASHWTERLHATGGSSLWKGNSGAHGGRKNYQ